MTLLVYQCPQSFWSVAPSTVDILPRYVKRVKAIWQLKCVLCINYISRVLSFWVISYIATLSQSVNHGREWYTIGHGIYSQLSLCRRKNALIIHFGRRLPGLKPQVYFLLSLKRSQLFFLRAGVCPVYKQSDLILLSFRGYWFPHRPWLVRIESMWTGNPSRECFLEFYSICVFSTPFYWSIPYP